MKKFVTSNLIMILMLILMLICLASCGGQQQANPSDDQNVIVEQENTEGKEIGQGENVVIPKEDNDYTDKKQVGAEQIDETKTDEEEQYSIDKEPPEGTNTINAVYHCTISITCNTVFDNLDKLELSKLDILPTDGIILSKSEVEVSEGQSVFDVLLRVTRDNKIHMEFSSNPAFNSKYIEGINNLYEFDCGELSGWTYKVNGKGVGYGSSNYTLSDGDVVEWVYTCDQGRDVGLDGVSQ